MKFAFTPLKVAQPIVSLGGRRERPRPLIAVSLIGPIRTVPIPCLLDTGADDTVFQLADATLAGIELSNAIVRESRGVSGSPLRVRFAQVNLRLTDGIEFREWPAWVGFTAAPLRHSLLGFAGCLQFFTATFHGDREEVELTVNSQYPGT